MNFPKTTIVLAAHGAPATDYPGMKVGLLMALEFAGPRFHRIGFLRRWQSRLDNEIRNWPRTTSNDPYKAAVDELAAGLQTHLGQEVIVGYNEFCLPDMASALDQAASTEGGLVVIVPTMLLRGNAHTEAEIREAVEAAQARHPSVRFCYAWPFDLDRMVQLFAGQVEAALV